MQLNRRKILSYPWDLCKRNSYPPCSHGLVHLLDTTLKLGKTGSPTLPRVCQRAEREASWREHSHRTRWGPAGSSDVQPASEPIHYTFPPRSSTTHATLGFLPGAAPQNKWMVENLLPPPLKPSKTQSAAQAVEAKSYRTHIICVRGLTLPSGLVLQNSACRAGRCRWQF